MLTMLESRLDMNAKVPIETKTHQPFFCVVEGDDCVELDVFFNVCPPSNHKHLINQITLYAVMQKTSEICLTGDRMKKAIIN